MQKEINIGKPFGLDAKIQVKTEQSGTDLYKLWDDLKVNVPMFLGSLPNPVTSSKRTHVIITHNPQNSDVKQLDFLLKIGKLENKRNESKLLILLNIDFFLYRNCFQGRKAPTN